MWYRTRRLAQVLNIPGPIAPVGPAPIDAPQAPQIATPETPMTIPRPHENCKCRLEIQGGGVIRWITDADPCDACKTQAAQFNAQGLTMPQIPQQSQQVPITPAPQGGNPPNSLLPSAPSVVPSRQRR